ncbi:putative integral membrane protein [Acanthocheilonema viteae]
MGDISLNTRYLSSNRGIIKIVQIILGFVVCSLLCTSWYGGRSCFGEGRIGFCSGLNFVVLVINIVIFIINFLNINAWKLERVYSIVCVVLFLIASILIIWFIIEVNTNRTSLIITTICLIVEFLLFLQDVKILQGEAPN